MLQVSFVLLSLCTVSILAQGANHANVHRGWHLGQGPYFCGTDADGDGSQQFRSAHSISPKAN
ncbi:MAG: hypothetical protein Q9219_004886 [cf. Caloplaca sp. 3 TL-2023]